MQNKCCGAVLIISLMTITITVSELDYLNKLFFCLFNCHGSFPKIICEAGGVGKVKNKRENNMADLFSFKVCHTCNLFPVRDQ